ncbi:MAG: YigZ family protein [Clostridiales bacterium]|nr:YigZ family protein [Clostridiales bacterium]
MDKDTFITVGEECTYEFEEKKSIFIASVFVVTSKEQAQARVDELKQKYYDATHNCYAYVLRDGAYRKFSDDGEPSGTAGMPILNVIERLSLCNTLVVVTRYFGGIKLGAGGLVRAYSTAAAEVLTKAGKSIYVKGSRGTIDVDYDDLGLVERYLNSSGVTVDAKTFGNGVTISVTTNKPWEEIENTVTDICAGGAICELEGNVWVKQSDID